MAELSPRLQPLFEKTRTVCFGRFLMQIPATATLVYGPALAEGDIEFFGGEAAKLGEHLAARLAEIEQEREFLKGDRIPKFPLFGKVIDGIVPGQKIVFGSKDRVGYAIDSFIPVGKDLFVHYLNTSLPKYDEVPMFNRIASHLHSRSEDEIPAEPGSCIEGGFISLEKMEYEWVRIGIRLKEFPDVHLSVDVHKNLDTLREDGRPSVLRERAKERLEATGLGAVFARIKIFRQRERQLGPWKGEELATRLPAYKDETDAHEFRFHSVGAVHDPLQPEIDIRLDSSVKDNRKVAVSPSITDEEALALWDKLITTIRVRKPSDATSITTAQPRVPLASTVSTGEICPQTGWWESTDGKDIGGGRRLLRAGEQMPLALLLSGAGLWKKLTGDRDRQVATVWKLVEYHDEPGAESRGPQNTPTKAG